MLDNATAWNNDGRLPCAEYPAGRRWKTAWQGWSRGATNRSSSIASSAGRSLSACQLLKTTASAIFYNLKGGIAAWRNPTCPFNVKRNAEWPISPCTPPPFALLPACRAVAAQQGVTEINFIRVDVEPQLRESDDPHRPHLRAANLHRRDSRRRF